jgi:N6-adenosine-specific RNA methylase IME4
MTEWPFGALRPYAYDVIVADPPWLFEIYSDKGAKKAPQGQYRCMNIEAIEALPVNRLARANCCLFLWTSAPLLDRAFDVLGAWRFRYVSRIAWRKTTVNAKVRVGPGYIARTMHEDVLIARLGNPAYRKALPSLFDGLAREHSRKPENFYAHVEAFTPNAFRLDLFSRASRPGWDVFGDECGKFDLPEVAAHG